jgi:hypothetical protein
MRGFAQRPHHVCDDIARLQISEFRGALAHALPDQSDGTPLRVHVGDGQRDSLAVVIVDADNNELAGLSGAGNKRGFYVCSEDVRRKLAF